MATILSPAPLRVAVMIFSDDCWIDEKAGTVLQPSLPVLVEAPVVELADT